MSPLDWFKTRFDSWLNAVTNVGSATGRNAFQFERTARLDDETLESLYHGDPFAARVCDVVPDEALREGFSVTCGSDPALSAAFAARLDELGAREKTADVWTWARVYGGSALFVGADDGQDPRHPLSLDAIRTVRFVTVLTKREMQPQDWYRDPLAPKFGEVERYRFVRNGVGATDQRTVHESRIIRFDGARTSRWRRLQNEGWSESYLDRVVDQIRALGGAFAAVGTLLQDSSQGVFGMKDLVRMMAEDSDGAFKKRMELLDMSRSVGRAVLIDADGESYTRTEVGALSGLPDVLDKFMLYLAGAAQIPVTLLMGQSPAGMNATGASDLSWFRTRIKAEQTNTLRPRLERLVRLLMLAQDGPTHGVEPDDWSIEFANLEHSSPTEEAALRKSVADTDAIYIATQVLTPEEVAINRFRAEGWSAETSLDLTARQAAVDADALPEPAVNPALTPGTPPAALPPGTPPADPPAPESRMNGGA